jgi:hypothetical protein
VAAGRGSWLLAGFGRFEHSVDSRIHGDAGFVDAGFVDAGFVDAGFKDAGFKDAGFKD